MGFFTKKKRENIEKESPDLTLPELPSLPELPKIFPKDEINKPFEETTTILPSFPKSQLGERISQNTIKEAIGEKLDKKMTREIKGNPIMASMIPKIPERAERKPLAMEMYETSDRDVSLPKTRPLFIKLDTFEKSISSFNEIKLRISEIESLLRNIIETKSKEERELDNWRMELESIKSRLKQIDRDIFSNMD